MPRTKTVAAQDSLLDAQPKKSRLYCNHCKQPAAHRRDLNDRWLCSTCAAIPSVRGYWDPSKRGLDPLGVNSDDWWKQNGGRVHIVSDDEKVLPAGNSFPAPPPSSPKLTLRQWQFAVLADAALDGELKAALVRLSMCADWKTGRNIWPSYPTLAAFLGRTAKQARTLVAAAIRAQYVIATPRCLKGRGKTSNRYTLRWPDGRVLGSDPTALPEHDWGRASALPEHDWGSRSGEPSALPEHDRGSPRPSASELPHRLPLGGVSPPPDEKRKAPGLPGEGGQTRRLRADDAPDTGSRSGARGTW